VKVVFSSSKMGSGGGGVVEHVCISFTWNLPKVTKFISKPSLLDNYYLLPQTQYKAALDGCYR
jgi:hypothetical protein